MKFISRITCGIILVVMMTGCNILGRNKDSMMPFISSSDQCISKGGFGVINPTLYIRTNSERNALDFKSTYSALDRWTGQDKNVQEMVVYYEEKIWPKDSLPATFDMHQSVVVSFEGDKVWFFDYTRNEGGYYSRKNAN